LLSKYSVTFPLFDKIDVNGEKPPPALCRPGGRGLPVRWQHQVEFHQVRHWPGRENPEALRVAHDTRRDRSYRGDRSRSCCQVAWQSPNRAARSVWSAVSRRFWLALTPACNSKHNESGEYPALQRFARFGLRLRRIRSATSTTCSLRFLPKAGVHLNLRPR